MGSIGAISSEQRFLEHIQDRNIGTSGTFKPLSGYSDTTRKESQTKLDETVRLAQDAGYEIYRHQRPLKRGSTYLVADTSFEVPVKNGESKITKSSSIGKAVEDAKNEYSDVIILQTRPTEMSTSSRRGGYYSQSAQATYSIFVRRK